MHDVTKKSLSPSQLIAAKTLYTAFKVMRENDGELSFSEIIKHLTERLEFTDWEKEVYETSGYIRWHSILSWYSVDAVQGGFIRKIRGKWVLTKEGEDLLKLSQVDFIRAITNKYKSVRKRKLTSLTLGENVLIAEADAEGTSDKIQRLSIEKLESDSKSSIRDYIYSKNPYQFQDLVAALLEGMGYYVSFVATKGKDGGVDIIAYQDPLGIKLPKIKVQVKHYTSNAPIQVSEIRSLLGLLDKTNDIGLFVTSSRFSNDALKLARESHIHIELIDFDKFVDLWIEFYTKLNDEQKNMLPIKALYFLGVNE